MVEDGLVLDAIQYWIGQKDILRNVYLHVPPGRICGLLGPNGCGKTTLLKVAAGQLRPRNGAVWIDGKRYARPARRSRFASLSYLPQETMLPHSIPVHHLEKGALFFQKSIPGRGRVGDLSGGELRLLELSIVLSLNRRYVLLDEPFTGVEPILVEQMIRMLQEYITGDRAVLLTDHLYESVLEIADDLYVMNDGSCLRLKGADVRRELAVQGYL